MPHQECFAVLHFNSRPCVRGDLLGVIGERDALNFNSRPCVRGDTRSLKLHQTTINFNSRPCVRGDPTLRFPRKLSPISIPAPA